MLLCDHLLGSNDFYCFPKLQLKLWVRVEAGDAKKNRWIQISLLCPTRLTGLVGYCLVAKLLYRLNGGACWSLQFLLAQVLSHASVLSLHPVGWKKVYDDKQVPLPMIAGCRHSGKGGG